jgi:hypothetical protein
VMTLDSSRRSYKMTYAGLANHISLKPEGPCSNDNK